MKLKNEKYINLKVNGRLFPTWVLSNFNRFKLPEIFIDDTDPCNDKKIGTEIRKYQEFVSNYLDYNSPYRDILLYHGLGSGKTRTAINVYNILYNYSPEWNVFILLKATLIESTWKKELDRWLQKEEKDFRKSNVHFISYDAPNADKIFLEKVKNVDVAKKSMYVIDEVHNFINNVYTNMTSRQGRRALTIYDHIIQDKKDNDSVRVVLISGSPAINIPFELALLFNLLRPDIFPKSESLFNQLYVSTDAYPIINPATKNNFQRRIMGLVSNYIGSTPDYYARKIVNYVDIPMSEYQSYIYDHYEALEEKIARKSQKRSKSTSNYKTYTRQSCNFVFPFMEQGISGETRPRPRDFKLNDYDIENVNKGNEVSKEKYYKVSEYFQKTELFVNSVNIFLKKKLNEDIKNNYTLVDDIKKFKSNTGNKFDVSDYIEYINSSEKKSELLIALHNSSAKMTYMIFNIMISPGPVLVYSNYVDMEGFQILKIYLKYFGFTYYNDPKNTGEDDFRYIEYHGKIDKNERRKVLEVFNRIENKLGSIIKIIMISPAGSEGISLNNVRQTHLLEPYWNEVRMKQMIGRAIRQCSHKDLPVEDREVIVYRYKSVRGTGLDKWTADQQVDDISRSKEGLIQTFLDAIKEVAVDCVLNKAHNILGSNNRCFQFEEKSLFDDQIGPAYKDDLYDDMKLNNGLNSQNSRIKKIKIIKIKAVIQLVSDEDYEANPGNYADKFSEPSEYWFNAESLTVYDLDLQYPVGKVGADDDGIALKLNADTYIITKMIPIPILKKN